jgi:ribonucleoside-diphosphate reductase alpha chain
MINAGIACEEDKHNSESWVFSFPMKSPSKSLTRHEVDPISQLELWKHFAINWCEHKPSMTCYVPEDSWASVASWIWDNWDIVNGISFLPSSDEGHIYEQAPYEDISSDVYKGMKKSMPSDIDWMHIVEEVDATTASQELACIGDSCEI